MTDPAPARARRRSPARAAAEPARAPQSDTAARVLRQFRQVFNAVKTHFQQVEKRAGLGGAQLWALSVIQARPGIGVNDLARAMDVHQSTASNLVRALLEAELIHAERGAADRRAVQLTALAAGKRVLRQAPGPFAGVLPDALAQLDPDTLGRLEADLAALLALLETDSKAARTPLADM